MADDPSPAARQPHRGTDATRDILSAVVETLPVLAWTAQPDGSIDYLNRQWLQFTGLPPEDALGWAWLATTHPADRERVSATWRTAIASGQPAEAEVRLRRADGAYLWFLARAVALRDEAGHVLKWYGTSTEIEERWRAEQALRASEHNFREIIDSVPGLLFTTTARGDVEFVNRPLLDYFGVGLAELQRWRQTDHVHPDDLARTIDEITRGFASLRPFTFDQRLRRADGAYRCFRLHAAPLEGPDGEVVRWYGVLTDVNEQCIAEAALAAARERLARAMQLAATSELAASISLGVMRPLEEVLREGQACLQSLGARPLDADRVRSHADIIVREANAAADVVRRIRGLFLEQPPRSEV